MNLSFDGSYRRIANRDWNRVAAWMASLREYVGRGTSWLIRSEYVLGLPLLSPSLRRVIDFGSVNIDRD